MTPAGPTESGLPEARHLSSRGNLANVVGVRDIGALTARLKTAGIDIVSTGGTPVMTPAGRQLLVRDPSGFLVLKR